MAFPFGSLSIIGLRMRASRSGRNRKHAPPWRSLLYWLLGLLELELEPVVPLLLVVPEVVPVVLPVVPVVPVVLPVAPVVPVVPGAGAAVVPGELPAPVVPLPVPPVLLAVPPGAVLDDVSAPAVAGAVELEVAAVLLGLLGVGLFAPVCSEERLQPVNKRAAKADIATTLEMPVTAFIASPFLFVVASNPFIDAWVLVSVKTTFHPQIPSSSMRL